MIHYNQLAKKVAEAKPGENVILKVSGLVSPGRDKTGEAKPAPLAEGALVKVNQVFADAVQVQDAKGKKLTFHGARGASRLELTPQKDFPKTGSPV